MAVIIDVREKDEFAAERAVGAVNIPLSDFAHLAPGILQCLKDRDIAFMCRSGARAQLALEQAKQMGFSDVHRFSVFPGGILSWKDQGNQVEAGPAPAAPLPIMRQVQIGAGFLVLLGVVLSFWASPSWIYLSGFVGVGLVFAGVTGFCGMALVLQKMPWNNRKPAACER